MKPLRLTLAALACLTGSSLAPGMSAAFSSLQAPASPNDFVQSQDAARPTFEEIRWQITPEAIITADGDFDAYYEPNKKSMEGYALEHIVSESEVTPDGQQELRKAGRLSPVDFEHVDNKTGKVIDNYQCKRTLTAKDIQNPKYAGQKFITTQESRRELARQLAKEEANAARRGLPLSEPWQKVKDAFDEGRIPEKLPVSGEPLPTNEQIGKHARREVRKSWDKTFKELPPETAKKLEKAKAVKRAKGGKVARTAKTVVLRQGITAVRAIATGAAITVLAETAIIWHGYESGEIQDGDLPERIGLAGVHTAIMVGAEGALFLCCTNPAGWTVLAVGVAAAGGAIAVDHAWEWWKDNYGSKSVSMEDLAKLLPPELHAMLTEPSNVDRWNASRDGDPDAWEKDWRP